MKEIISQMMFLLGICCGYTYTLSTACCISWSSNQYNSLIVSLMNNYYSTLKSAKCILVPSSRTSYYSRIHSVFNSNSYS